MGEVLIHNKLNNFDFYLIPDVQTIENNQCAIDDEVKIFEQTTNNDITLHLFTGDTTSNEVVIYKMFAPAAIPNKVSFHVNFIFGKNSSVKNNFLEDEENQCIYGLPSVTSYFNELNKAYYFPLYSDYTPNNRFEYISGYQNNVLILDSITIDSNKEHIVTTSNNGVTFGNFSISGENEFIDAFVGAGMLFYYCIYDSNVNFGNFWTKYVDITDHITLEGTIFIHNVNKIKDSTKLYKKIDTNNFVYFAQIEDYQFLMNLEYNNKLNVINIYDARNGAINYTINLNTDSNLTVTSTPQGYLIEGDLILPYITVSLNPKFI